MLLTAKERLQFGEIEQLAKTAQLWERLERAFEQQRTKELPLWEHTTLEELRVVTGARVDSEW